MEYLLKLHANSVSLATEVKKALYDEYRLDVAVGEIGSLNHHDNKLVWLEVVNSRKEQIELIAVGYDEGNGWSAKYRIFGHIEKYCPSCKVFRNLSAAGRFCSICGAEHQYVM